MHVRRALALTLAVPVLLAGCSDDPEPKPKIPETTSSSPTPTPTESETPEAESPEDFIRRWQEAGDEMQATGETAEYRALVRTCKACQTFVDQCRRRLRRWRLGRVRRVAKSSSIEEIAVKPPTFDVDVNDCPRRAFVESHGEPADASRQDDAGPSDPRSRPARGWHGDSLRDLLMSTASRRALLLAWSGSVLGRALRPRR